MTWWMHGALGLLKAWTGLDRASDDVIALRRMACVVCPHRHKKFCVKCGCYLREKTLVASEHCPVGKW